MLKTLGEFWKNEKGRITTTEAIGYTLLIGGAVALVGFGLAALARGKTGDVFGGIQSIKAMSGSVNDASTYGYTTTTESSTGITNTATGN